MDDIAVRPDEERKFDPMQKRDPDGKWGDGIPGPGGALKDALKLAGRIDLEEGEALAGSGHLDLESETGMDVVWAAVDSPRNGRVYMIGTVHEDDVKKWRAADLGSTVPLPADGASQLLDDLSAAESKANDLSADAEDIWETGEAPSDPVLRGENPVAEGTVDTDWGPVVWSVYLDDSEPVSYVTDFRVGDNGDTDAVKLDADGLSHLIAGLDRVVSAPETSRSAFIDSGLCPSTRTSGESTADQVAEFGKLLSPGGVERRSEAVNELTSRALAALEARMFTEEDHPRGQKGSANGGQFAKKNESKQSAKNTSSAKSADPPGETETPVKSSAQRKPTKVVIPKGALGYDPASNHGTGYGIKGGDKNVHALQDALNRLGFTDLKGRKLAKDGKLGPLTTSAVKKAQKALGLKQDGIVTPDLLKKLTGMKAPGHTAGAAAGQAAKKAAPKRRPSHRVDIRPARQEADAAAAKKLSAATGIAAQPRPRVGRVDYANPPGRSASHDLCTRAFDFDTDLRGGDGRTLEGYAAVFDTAARIKDHQGDFDEVIRSGAFKRSLARRMPVLQFDHGKDPRIGGTPIGKIDALSEDTRGLHVRARLFSHPDVERVREAIAEGAVSGMSFRFGVPKGGDIWSRRTGDVDLREIRDTDIHELGPVVFPAYDSTTVSVRSMLAGLADDEMRTLVRELADHFGLAVDLTSLTGRSGTRSADGGDTGTPPRGERVPAIATPQSPGDPRLLEQALKAIGAL